MKQQIRRERSKLVLSIERLLEGPMVFLGFVWLVLLMIELVWGLSPVLETCSLIIWALFIIDFLLKFFVAPVKIQYLKQNWNTLYPILFTYSIRDKL